MINHLAHLRDLIVAQGVSIESIDANGVVSPASSQAAAQPVIDAFDDSDAAQLIFQNTQARTIAGSLIDTDKTALLKILRAEAGLTIDELNVLRQWITDFKAAVAASTNLANLQTRVAALSNLPARTQAQAITAIKAKIDGGTVD